MAVVQSLHFGGVLQRFVILIPDPVIFDSGFGIRTNSLYRFCSKARMSATAGSYRFSMQWRLPTWGLAFLWSTESIRKYLSIRVKQV